MNRQLGTAVTGRSRTTTARRGLATAACLAVVAVAGGCSSDAKSDSDGTKETPASKPSGTQSKVPASTQVFPDMGKNFSGVVDDVDPKSCALKQGKAVATGVVENTAKEPRDLMVGVIWLAPSDGDNKGGRDTIALKHWQAKNVPPGGKPTYKVEVTLPAAAAECVYQAKANQPGTLK